MRYTFILFLFFILPNKIIAQSLIPVVSVETGGVFTKGKNAPFWFYSNQYGKISPKNNSIYLLPSIYRDYNKESKVDYKYVISPLIRYDGLGRSYMHQWYGEIKIHFTRLTFGAKEEFYGNQDSILSTGFILWSKNARPMPKMTFSVPEYTSIPFTWKYLEFKGGMSHGWFGDNEYNKNVWLHHKYFYLRLGGKLPVHISYGLHDFAQWGGTSYEPYGKLPHDFNAFKKIFFARSGNPADPNTPWSEWANKLGNHIGSRNFGLELDAKKAKMALYWQNIFEDGSGKAYRNIKDGLWGISLRRKDEGRIISAFVYEFFNSTDQSGIINETDSIMSDGTRHELGGNDNYFNNGIYIKGWTYKEMIIGSPLITSPAVLESTRYDYARNNRVLAHHIGIEGFIKKVKYKFLYTYSLNYGTNFYPFRSVESNHSVFLRLETINISRNITLSCSIGTDIGKLYGTNTGIMLAFRKDIF